MRDRIERHYAENFDQLVKRYDRRAGGVMNAEDVVQEGYTRALQYMDSSSVDNFDAWLGTIMNNALKDLKSAEFPRTPPEEEEYTESADDAHYRRTQVKVVVDRIESFDRPKRDILWLWYIKEYSVKDIRKVLDVNTSLVKITVHRFKKMMQKDYPQEE